MSARPQPEARQPAELGHVDRVLRAVFGDMDYLGRLDSMVRGRAHLTDADVGSVVEQAVAEAVRQVRSGRRANDPQALVWWLAERKAGKLQSERGETLSYDEALRERVEDEVSPHELARWRDLVARIDQERPRQVWSLLLSAIEAGEDLLSGAEIATHLGIPETAVRTAISRGRQQLRRLAESEGLVRLLDDGTVIVEFDDD